jgi:hypothetical protein
MNVTADNTEKLLNFVSQKFENNELTNDSLVQLIELSGRYLNLQTISKYAAANDMSYNGVKKCRNVIKLFETKFVIDNE